jgi:glutaredoxin 3
VSDNSTQTVRDGIGSVLELPLADPIYPASFISFSEIFMPKIEVYSTAVCPYCVAAKNLLKSKGLEWNEVRVDTDPVQRDAMLARSGGRRTVPQIFVNDQLVGGYDDLVAADRSGRLTQLLEASV